MGKITWEIPEGVKKEDILTLDVIDSKGNVKKKTQKISEFFNHLVSYGGFCIEEGTMKIWGDPSIFIPIEGFIEIIKIMKEEIGKETTNEIFYWLGRLYGKNSTLMLMKRFGFKKENLKEFVNGATQDGMGYLQIQEYDKKNFEYGVVIGTNSVLAENYKKNMGKTKEPVDYYLAGILAGGVEPLVNRKCIVKEIECVAKGNTKCVYYLKATKKELKFPFFKKIGMNEQEILKKTKTNALKRKSKFKIFGGKEISFGNGKFILRDKTGINFPVYNWNLLEEIIYKTVGEESYKKILEKISKKYIEQIGNKKEKPSILNRKNIEEKMKNLEIFCLGKIEIKNIFGKKIIIKNYDEEFYEDKKSLNLNLKKISVIECIIKETFKNNFKKEVLIKKKEKREKEGTIFILELL